jgi:uncharacterized protein (DUF302 family)
MLGALLSVNVFAAEKVHETPHLVLYVTDGTFTEVKSNVELAITDQGLVVNNVSTVGNMLERTGKDLGATRKLYTQGDVLEFCSAGLSREMMEADQTNIVFCPYTIQVYAIPEQPGKVYVGYRRVPVTGSDASKAAIEKVNALLAKIVAEALSW